MIWFQLIWFRNQFLCLEIIKKELGLNWFEIKYYAKNSSLWKQIGIVLFYYFTWGRLQSNKVKVVYLFNQIKSCPILLIW